MYKLFILSLLVTSCGTDLYEDYFTHKEKPKDRKPPVVEVSLQAYVSRFEKLYGQEVSMPISFKQLEAPTVGVCHSWTDGYREIDIDPEAWENMGELGREELMFHELGHCALNRPHVETTMDKDNWTGIPVSIMYPYIFGDTEYYKQFKQHYYKELFTK